MTTATITETLATPAGGSTATLRQTKVRLRLVAASGGVATAYTSGLTAVVADSWAAVEDDGTYSFTGVRPNSGSSGDVITTPTGTVYELTVVYPDRTTLTRYISVPDSAGPHAPADIVTADPTDLTSYGYYLDKEDRVHGRPLTEPLRGLATALAAADSSPVDIVVVGDSLSEDWQWVDSGTSESVGLRSWVRLLEVDLADRFHSGAVGVGWVPVRAGLGTNPGWDTITGSAVTDRGLGQYAVQLDAGEYAEHTEICDGVDVYFASIASTCTVHVDGVLTATLTASAVPTVWSSGALSISSHTIKVTAVGGIAYPYGSYWYLGNRTSGVRVHNGGHSGWGPLDHLNKVGTLEHIALVDPDCVIVPIGAAANNPPTSAGGGFDDGLVDYRANIEDLLAAIVVEAPTAAVVHVAEHAFTGRASTWSAFAVASRQLAVEAGYGFADCYETIGYVGGDPYSLAIFDEVHLNAKGQRVMADTILAAIAGSTSRGEGVVSTAPGSGTVDITLLGGGGPRARLYELLTTVGWYLKRASDTAERAALTDTGIAYGDGTNAVDAVIQRVSAGVLAVTGAFRFTEQSAPSSPAANTLVVYAADNGSGTTVLRTKDSAGTVTTLGAAGGGSYTDEQARDAIGTALVAGEGIDITVNDGADTITIDAELASATNPGVVELGTDAETQTGTDTARAPSLASAAATFFRKLIPTSTTGTITHADGGAWSFYPFGGIPFFGLRRTGDSLDRAALSESSLSFGDGSGLADATISRTASGVLSVSAGKLRPGTPSNTLDAADKAYVDGRTPAASTAAAGVVELATAAEVTIGTDTTRAITPAGAATHYATLSGVAAAYQPLDTELTAIAGLTSAADKGIQFTGAGTAATFDLTAAGKALLDDATVAGQRTTLGLWEPTLSSSGVYIAANGTRTGSITNAAWDAAGDVVAAPVWIPARTYDRIGIYYYAAGTSTLRLGVWNMDSAGWPGTVALDAGTVSVTAADGVVRKEITTSQAFTAGWYWVGMQVDAYTSTAAMIGYQAGNALGLLPGARSTADTNQAYSGVLQTGATTGSLATWGSTITLAGVAPMVYLRSA